MERQKTYEMTVPNETNKNVCPHTCYIMLHHLPIVAVEGDKHVVHSGLYRAYETGIGYKFVCDNSG